MSAAPQWVFSFGGGASEGDPARADLLGGKGASLAAMSRAGFPVPPGFTISSECCAYAQSHAGAWPPGLDAQVRAVLVRLEEATGRRFGRGPRPLYVAVRSGAGVSMPGMMDTILNCGMSPLECGDSSPLSHSSVSHSPSPSFSWKDYAEHIRMFAASVAGLKLLECGPLECGSSLPLCDGDPREPRAVSEPLDRTSSFASESVARSIGQSGDESPHSKVARTWLAEYEHRTGRPFPTDPWDALVQCINAVFASWNSERARAYRQHHDIRNLAGTAVNVQMMFPSERSGVLFTVNPQQPDAGEMILEASWGLGEAVVSGAVTPDIYVIDRETLALKSVVPGDRPESRPALSESEVRELAELGRHVERHFGVPSDIEWGISDGKVALLQTRAIRGLDVLRAAEELRQAEIARLKEIAGDRHVVWVVHNLGETLPHPTPLTWDIVRWFMSGDGGFGRMYRKLGFSPSRAVCERGFLELICGRIYVDPLRAAGLFWGTLPFEYDAAAILADRQTLERPPTKMNFDEADPFLFARLPGLLWSMGKSSRTMRRMRCALRRSSRRVGQARLGEHRLTTEAESRRREKAETRREKPWESGDESPHSRVPARERFEREALPSLDAFLRDVEARPLPSLTLTELLAELDRRIEFVLGDFAAESLLPGFFGGIAREELERWLVQILGSEPRGAELTGRLTTGLEGDVTVEQNVRLYAVAREREQREGSANRERSGGVGRVTDPSYVEFLCSFGHRSAQEMELSQPRWSEDDSFLERMLASFRAATGTSPADRHAEQVALRHSAEAELPRLLEENGASSLRERIETLLVEAQTLLPYREIGKYHLMRGYAAIRAVLVELAGRWSLGRDLFFLERAELAEFESRPADFRAVLARRRTEWQGAQKLALGDVVDSRELDDLGKPPRRDATASGGHFTARPIAPGHASGPARIVRDPSAAGGLGTGYILVCGSTDPGWTPLFLNCRGLIVERGGILSHGAIVARDFGIPAVVLEGATQLLPEGVEVEVDAHHGTVAVQSRV